MTPFKSLEQLEADGWSSYQIDEQRDALLEGLDLSNLDPTCWDFLQMTQQRFALRHGRDLSILDPRQGSWAHLAHQRTALEHNLDVVGIIPHQDWAGLAPCREDGRRFTGLNLTLWSEKQMQQQFIALVDGLDLTHLDPAHVTADQMRQHRNALLRGELPPSPTVKARASR